MKTAIVITYKGDRAQVSGPAPAPHQKALFKELTDKDGDRAELWLSDSGVAKRKRLTGQQEQPEKPSKKPKKEP